MSRLLPKSLLLALTLNAPALATAQEAPSPSATMPVLQCVYDGNIKVIPPDAGLGCATGLDGKLTRHTFADLLNAGWRISHYAPLAWNGQVRHYFIFESK